METESILTSIKKLLGIQQEYTVFDADVMMHINSVLSILTQIGIGPKEGFMITDESATWHDFIGEDLRFQSVKSFVYMKVKLLFDPPNNGSVVESMNQIINELEWRLNVSAENN